MPSYRFLGIYATWYTLKLSVSWLGVCYKLEPKVYSLNISFDPFSFSFGIPRIRYTKAKLRVKINSNLFNYSYFSLFYFLISSCIQYFLFTSNFPLK